jgi:hypothetical protein
MNDLYEGMIAIGRLAADIYTVETLAQYKLVKPLEPVRTELSDEEVLHARVEWHEDHYQIHVSKATFFVLNSIFRRALASPAFMPWIEGKSSQQSTTRPGVVGAPLDSPTTRRAMLDSIMKLSVTPESGKPLPRDLCRGLDVLPVWRATREIELSPARSEAAMWLTTQCLRVIIAHEIRHVLAGHIKYKGTLGYLHIDESQSRRASFTGDQMEIWAMEADADDHSARVLVSNLQTAFRMMPDETNEWRFLTERWHLLFVQLLCMNAIHFLFDAPWLIEQNPHLWLRSPYQDHHTHGLRRGLALASAASFLETLDLNLPGNTVESGATVAHLLHLQLDKLLCQIFGDQSWSDWGLMGWAMHVEFHINTIQKIEQAQSTLRPKLMEHAYVKL